MLVLGQPPRQETETQAHQKWLLVEAAVWTVRMLAALVNGVKACPERGRRGGKWFSLMDKIYAERTLQIARQRVRRNQEVE
jgi:RNA-directed DNA polymerase